VKSAAVETLVPLYFRKGSGSLALDFRVMEPGRAEHVAGTEVSVGVFAGAVVVPPVGAVMTVV